MIWYFGHSRADRLRVHRDDHGVSLGGGWDQIVTRELHLQFMVLLTQEEEARWIGRGRPTNPVMSAGGPGANTMMSGLRRPRRAPSVPKRSRRR